MPVLVTSKFDKDPIKTDVLAWTHNFPIISLWELFRHSRASNSKGNVQIWPKFKLLRDFMPVLLPASLTYEFRLRDSELSDCIMISLAR